MMASECLPRWVDARVRLSSFSRQAVANTLWDREWITDPIMNASDAVRVVFADGSEHEISQIRWTDERTEIVYTTDSGVGVVTPAEVVSNPDVILE